MLVSLSFYVFLFNGTEKVDTQLKNVLVFDLKIYNDVRNAGP